MKIIFFGSDKFVLPILEKLHTTYEIPFVLTTEKSPTDPISAFAKDHMLPCINVKKFTPDIIKHIQAANVDIAVLAYFGLILPNTVLSLFPKGIINVHPSLLPKFRGPTPVQSAIMAGEKETGVSIIKLDNAVDHGPILAQATELILDEDTAETLHEKLFTKGAELVMKILPDYISGNLVPKPQDDRQATFTEKLTRDSGYIDLSVHSRDGSQFTVERMIRAYYPWPGVWTKTKINNYELRIKFLPAQSHPELDCGSNPFLLQVEGKKPMSYKDFLNGYPNVILPILQMSNTTNKK